METLSKSDLLDCLRSSDFWISTYLTLIGGGDFIIFKGTISSKVTKEMCSKKAMSMNKSNLAWLSRLP